MNENEQNAQAYDQIAARFDGSRRGFREKRYLDLLLAQLAPGASVLELGCGAGRPVARYLVDKGSRVVGVDHSSGMLTLARQYVPEAQFIQTDMLSFATEERFAAAVAWDAIFHIAREHHGALFQKIASWLHPNGLFLLSLGGSAWEGSSEMHGQTFFYSGFDPHHSRQLLEQAGFQIVLWEVDDPSSKGHLAILAQKVAEVARL